MTQSPIGQPQVRIDGAQKVSGKAVYTSDHSFPGMLYAVPVGATIAKGKLVALDVAAAESMPGVRAVFHHGNVGNIYRVPTGGKVHAFLDEKRPPLEDDRVCYYGQYIAVAIADTFEQASAAANSVKATYAAEKPDLDRLAGVDNPDPPKPNNHRGQAQKAFAASPMQLDQTYATPTQTHNSLELHATVAVWDGHGFTLYETVQGVVNQQLTMMGQLGEPKEQVRVISRFLGSGFGGKICAWPHCALAAVSARKLNRPIKLVISRQQAFQSAGHRPPTRQRVRIGATAEGKLISLQQDYVNHTSVLDAYHENCGEATSYLYSVPNLSVTSGIVRRNVGTPTSMRGPGAVPGLFATESAMNELAFQLKIDPVKLRVLNEPKIDEGLNIPFSSRHLVECYTTGAEKFGWHRRTPEVGSMTHDGLTLGWGTGGCSWIAERFPAEASIELRADGSVRVASGAQDIGTGTYTIMAQMASQKTGVPVHRIEVVLGDSSLPAGPMSGGSMATASLIPAISLAMDDAVKTLLHSAGGDLAYTQGMVHHKGQPPEHGRHFSQVLREARLQKVHGRGSSPGTFGGPKPKFSVHCYGAHFAEITWQPEIARLRVSRVVTVIDAGTILNPRAGRNQIEGAVAMGVGMALFEQTHYDARNGSPINANLADYLMTTNPDMPTVDVHFLDYPDHHLNELGAKGIGEIGLAGIASAITGAIHHATGIWVRELPVRIEDLLV